MKKILSIFATSLVALSLLSVSAQAQQTPVSYFGAIPDLKVSGKEFVDPTGKAVTLHGVMDTPNCYFNGGRWGWINYNSPSTNDINACKNYFTKVFQAIANPAKGSYCNLFRLHLDPAWLRDPSYTASGFTNVNDNAKTATDPNGHTVFDEANICHFSFDKMRTRMQDLYVPIIKDALDHGLYVVVRPPGVFPEDVKVGDYYNTYLLTVWDIVSSNDYVKSHAGQIMLELGNEPVRMSGNLADYFQPIVNKIRQNGFTGIILLPGTSYQADYRNYNSKAISDNNYGYAVHNYPGWYGGWDANQSEANFISTFEAQVPINQKPIIITEVDWSPMSEGKGHWNEEHTQYTEANFGTWGTGTTNGTTSGVKMQTTQNIGWGLRFRHLVDKHPNISFTLQGTSTYVDMDAYISNGSVKPAFEDAMKSEGYPDARQACSGYCFDWYKDFACGNRIPYGTPSVAPEQMLPTGSIFGNAALKNDHYEFYTSTFSAFIFDQFKGTDLNKCAELTIELGEATIGYRLDIEILDKDGNSIISGEYIIGTEDAGTRITNTTDALKQTFDLQSLLADYVKDGNKIGKIRLNTVVSSEDTNRAGLYYFTLSRMDMNVSEVTARTGSKGTSLTDVKMYRHTAETNYVHNNPSNLGGWGNGAITNNNDGSYKIVVSEKKNPWEGQFNVPGSYINGTEYTLQLDVKGSVASNIGAAIQKSEGYEGRGNFPSIPVTTSWQTVTVKATVEGEGADRILLNYGDYLGTLEIKNIKVSYMSDNATEITGNNIRLGSEATEGVEVFGAGLLGNVAWNEYADLSDYSKMIIKGTGGSLRVLYNRPATGDCPELNPSLASGEAVVDLTAYPYFHLNSIKAGWGQTVNVSSITLISGNGNNVDIADYYITGAGHITDAAQAALNDVKATVIDATGLTNTFPWSLSTANPNCLIIYKDDNQVGFTWNETTRNLVKSAGGYSAYRTNLYDGYDFRAPFAFNTVAENGATYTRDLTTEWATATLPFATAMPEGVYVYVLSKVEGNKMTFKKVEDGTVIAANQPFVYRKPTMGETTLYGNNIAQTAEGFNIQPISGLDGWFIAQSFITQVIDDVNVDPILKDYDVYGINGNEFKHATGKLTTKPFRAFFLHKKTAAAPAAYMIVAEEEVSGISSVEIQTKSNDDAYYNLRGQRVSADYKGIVVRKGRVVISK